MNSIMSRRDLLRRGLQMTAGAPLLLGLAACGDSDEGTALVCADPGAMSSAQESVRRTLRYVELSPDPSKRCSGCEFFSAAESGDCGSCGIFDGGPVNPDGHCDSWSVDA